MACAEADDAGETINVGLCDEKGMGVAADPHEAVKWFTRAAEAGNAEAQHNLGACFSRGTFVARDLAAARKWLARASTAGEAKSANALARLDAYEAAQP